MTIGTNKWEEEMTSMKVMPQKAVKESGENEACIKLQEKKIPKLISKLEKQSTQFVTKVSESEDEVKAYDHTEAFNEEVHSKKGISSRTTGF